MLGQEMYLNGKSTHAIGKELHLDRNALVRFMKSNGIEVERMPHKKKSKPDEVIFFSLRRTNFFAKLASIC